MVRRVDKLKKTRKVGRPKKELNQEEFEKLCMIQCTEVEFCAFFEVCKNTLNRWCNDTYGMNFCDIFELKRGIGKISLRRTQWQLAEKNVAMAIFLGKQYLGQTDEHHVAVENKDDSIKEMENYFAEQARNTNFDLE